MANDEFLQRFPYFKTCPDRLVAGIAAATQRHHFEKNRNVFVENDVCSAIAFMLSGTIRVYMLGSDGREITLYDVQEGETCILNVACILSNTRYPARATVTRNGDGLVMPAGEFRDLVDRYPEMRSFVYSGLGGRLISMMKLVEEVAFRRLDERLRRYVIEKAESGLLRTTHQKIANELGSSREMVSRLLEDLERRGAISLARNEIQILDL
jgi:CRP/FNR family transcriptional regulator